MLRNYFDDAVVRTDCVLRDEEITLPSLTYVLRIIKDRTDGCNHERMEFMNR